METPRKLSEKQKTLLKEFAEEAGEESHPESAGFFERAKHFFEQHTTRREA